VRQICVALAWRKNHENVKTSIHDMRYKRTNYETFSKNKNTNKSVIKHKILRVFCGFIRYVLSPPLVKHDSVRSSRYSYRPGSYIQHIDSTNPFNKTQNSWNTSTIHNKHQTPTYLVIGVPSSGSLLEQRNTNPKRQPRYWSIPRLAISTYYFISSIERTSLNTVVLNKGKPDARWWIRALLTE
jgi:hypothetical protein